MPVFVKIASKYISIPIYSHTAIHNFSHKFNCPILDSNNKSQNAYFDSDTLEKETVTLMLDEDVAKKSGIYPYVLDRDERHLSIRAFNKK